MMRKTNWIIAMALAVSAAGCAGPYDQAYAPSYGYGSGYYSSGYYAPQAYYSTPTVYRETRYVPVPTPVPVAVPQHQADRDHRWDGRHDEPRHVDRQPTPTPPPAATHNSGTETHNSGTASGDHHDRHDGNRRDGSRDRDNDRRS